MTIEKGTINKIEGGKEAMFVENWIKKLNHPNMYKLAHICYGFNPGAKLSGLCTEDERVWGGTEWGIGYQSIYYNGKDEPQNAVTHVDCTQLNCSVWLDEEQIMKDGKLIHSELKAIAKKLG